MIISPGSSSSGASIEESWEVKLEEELRWTWLVVESEGAAVVAGVGLTGVRDTLDSIRCGNKSTAGRGWRWGPRRLRRKMLEFSKH